MNKEQQAKYCDWARENAPGVGFPLEWLAVWEGCLKSNGINTEEPMETTAAPEWVIEMMRTGKAVRCRVNDNDGEEGTEWIDGYRLSTEYKYRDLNGKYWGHAEPIPAWQPKDGEAVLFRNQKGYAAAGVYAGRSVMHDTLCGWSGWDGMKPFDASKIGKPWSDINIGMGYDTSRLKR